MIIENTIEGIRKAVGEARKAGRSVGFVPTMGALHAGHASLMDAAARACDFVVVSIFVNPTQFAPTEDLAAYPRTPEKDQELCRSHGVGAVFMPSVAEMYPTAGLTEVTVASLAKTLCGASRPAHFAGVCTVVAKLFNIVGPDKAFFGAKDYQQAAIITRMAADLNFPIQVVVCPIVREADGLAMSSRNVYLSAEHRRQAVALSESLNLAKYMILQKTTAVSEVKGAICGHLAKRAPDGVIDYVQIIDPKELSDVGTTDCPVVIALAVKFGRTRLIDNILVDSGGRA